jgi:YD repeat-containing protein
MKVLVLSLIVLCVKTYSQSTNFEYDFAIKGSVKEMTVTLFQATKVGKEFKTEKKIADFLFVKNRSGKLFQPDYIGSDLWSQPQDVYNEKNQIVGNVIYSQENKILHRTKFIYDEKGMLIEEKFYNEPDTLSQITHYEYKNKLLQKQVSKKLKDIEPEFIKDSLINYIYDSNNNLVKIITEGSWNVIYKYNAKDFLQEEYIEGEFGNPDQKLVRRFSYLKSDEKNWTSAYLEVHVYDEKPIYYYLERQIKYEN